MKTKDIYFDGAANTPLDDKVFKAMKPYLSKKHVGNSFAIHNFGVQNMIAIEEARSEIANILGVTSNEVFFTSGATESNNWVIKTIALHELFYSEKPRLHMICSKSEHSSIINTCKMVEKWGIKVTYISGTGRYGTVTVKDVQKALKRDTCLVCVMAVNNETGVLNEADAIAQIAKKNKTLSLIDCTQWLSNGGKDTNLVNCFPHGDFFSFSAHKIYGPTGVGCLIARKDISSVLTSLITGGAQENGLRGGTSNTAAIVGMAKALKLMQENDYREHFDSLYERIVIHNINSHCFRLNAIPNHRNIMSLNFSDHCDIDNLAALFAAYGIAVSSGSACDTEHNFSTGGAHPSHVLKDLGLTDKEVRNTIRVSFTKYTTMKEVEKLIETMDLIVKEHAND